MTGRKVESRNPIKISKGRIISNPMVMAVKLQKFFTLNSDMCIMMNSEKLSSIMRIMMILLKNTIMVIKD